jgi:hypothetical protein
VDKLKSLRLKLKPLRSNKSSVAEKNEHKVMEEKNEHKAMDTKLLVSKFNVILLVKAYGDNLSTGSVRSHGGDHPLPATLFFQHISSRVAAVIGEPTLSDEYISLHGQKLVLLDGYNQLQLPQTH